MTEPTAAYAPTPEPSGPRFAPGEVLAGRFRVVAPLGKGGMGEVYRADDLHLGQPVVLKFLPAGVATDPDRLARFRKEVAAARQVSHPHVCRVYDLGEHAGQPFLAMEFVDGEDLHSVLTRLGRVPAEKGVEIARQLAGALAAVHDRGLVHRDLKPANVMLDGRGRVRLTDFGLAAAAEELSPEEARSGTPAYMAPEQLAGHAVTPRSDLFALGLVLFELFTGKRAFPAASRRELAAKYQAGLPSTPSSLTGGLDPAVERVILRCLEPDPAKRPASAVEVLAALPGGDPLAAAVAAGETPSPQLVADAGGSGLVRPWVGLLLLAGVAAGVLAFAALADRVALYRRVPLDPPAVQLARVRALLADAGHPDRPANAVW
jgi:serine/threonine protein kinase